MTCLKCRKNLKITLNSGEQMDIFKEIDLSKSIGPLGKNYKNDDIIRIDDLIYIEEPLFFERCGYPMTFADTYTEVKHNYQDLIHDFLDKMNDRFALQNGTNCEFDGKKFNDPNFNSYETIEKICGIMAHRLIELKQFGGRERRIHVTENKDAIRNTRLFRVHKISFCKTGTYVPAVCYDKYMGEYDDYEPARLDDIKTHKILHLSNHNGDWLSCIGLKIENIHVSKIHLDKRWFVCDFCSKGKPSTYVYKNMKREDLENWEQPCDLVDEIGEYCPYKLELAVLGQK